MNQSENEMVGPNRGGALDLPENWAWGGEVAVRALTEVLVRHFAEMSRLSVELAR